MGSFGPVAGGAEVVNAWSWTRTTLCGGTRPMSVDRVDRLRPCARPIRQSDSEGDVGLVDRRSADHLAGASVDHGAGARRGRR